MNDHVNVGNVKIISVQWYKILWKAHLLASWLAWMVKNTLQIFLIFVNNLGNSVTMLVNFGQFGRPMLLLYCYFAGVYVESSFQTAVSFDCANLWVFLRGNGAFHINYSWIPKRCWEKWFWQDLKTDRWMDKKVTPLWFRFC